MQSQLSQPQPCKSFEKSFFTAPYCVEPLPHFSILHLFSTILSSCSFLGFVSIALFHILIFEQLPFRHNRLRFYWFSPSSCLFSNLTNCISSIFLGLQV